MSPRPELAGALVALMAMGSADARGDELPVEEPELHHFARVETVGRLFRRDSYPQPGGALVAGGMAAPLFTHAVLRVEDADVPWGEDSIDAELSAWGNLQLGAESDVGRVDGDVQIAKVRQRFSHGYATFGRQVQGGGAARFVRYDGASAGLRAPLGGGWSGGMDGYGGFTVLPRWNGARGYHLLGSAADTMVRDPAVLADPAREENWLVGGRAHIGDADMIDAGLSFHEQRADGGLARRNAALDAYFSPLDELAITGRGILNVDATTLSDLRLVVDTFPREGVIVGASYQHLVPSLMLSRQSVLSVFSTSAFDEWGLDGTVRLASWLRLGADGYLQRFEGGSFGHRMGGHVRLRQEGRVPTTGRLGYRRVEEAQNGYHQLRAALSVRPLEALRFTADGFIYLYDAPIEDVSTSIVGVVSGGYSVLQQLEVLLATSLARSPYATTDAQGTVRVRYTWEGEG